MKLENCKIEPKNYPKLNKNELSIIEGLLFPYSEFGGYSFIINSKEYLKNMDKKQRNKLFILLDEKKSHQSSNVITYTDEKDIIELYNLIDYDSKILDIVHGFSKIREEKEQYEESVSKASTVKENIHDLILSYVDQDLEKIIEKYEKIDNSMSVPEIKLDFYRRLKGIVNSIDIGSLEDNDLLDLANKRFINFI